MIGTVKDRKIMDGKYTIDGLKLNLLGNHSIEK